MNSYVYTARAMYDENQGEWIVRLIRWDHNMGEQNGSEYVGLCAANGQDEAELIAAGINRSLAYGLGDQLDQTQAMFNDLRVRQVPGGGA